MKLHTLPSRLFFLFVFLSASVLMAQDVDHIYLKTGSVIRGAILEIEPSDHVKIEDLCGNIWFYNMADVEKIMSSTTARVDR